MRVLQLLFLLLASSFMAKAQSPIERLWYNAEKTAKIKVYKHSDNKYYGKIVWLKETTKNGQARTDENNPDAKKKKRALMGLMVLNGLVKDGNEYEDGTIYDPKSGKTYSCQAKMDGENLSLRGYIGISLIGRTSVWTPASE